MMLHAGDAGASLIQTRHFSHSIAVMSIIGYMLGLGDRHCENVLIDYAKAEVSIFVLIPSNLMQLTQIVHVDFNMCFERGRRLLTAETVPFRLTPNIRRALGPSGVAVNLIHLNHPTLILLFISGPLHNSMSTRVETNSKESQLFHTFTHSVHLRSTRGMDRL
jgi:hypothetical protein